MSDEHNFRKSESKLPKLLASAKREGWKLRSKEIERNYFWARGVGTYFVSKRFASASGDDTRISTLVMENGSNMFFTECDGEEDIYDSGPTRRQFKAVFFQGSRQIDQLIVQEYCTKSGPIEERSFSLNGQQIDDLVQFVLAVKMGRLDTSGKRRIPADEILEYLVSSL